MMAGRPGRIVEMIGMMVERAGMIGKEAGIMVRTRGISEDIPAGGVYEVRQGEIVVLKDLIH
jgi:hypothetical protein